VTKRVLQTPNELIYVSSVTVEEILIHGWYAKITESRGSKPKISLEQAFTQFHKSIRDLNTFNLLALNKESEDRYKSLPADAKRVGREDCKLAAHAIVAGATVVTRNTVDFVRIPHVKFEDWSRED